MKITNLKVVNVVQSIREYKSLLDPTPAKLTYTVSKHEPSLNKHAADFEEARVNTCKEFCIKDDKNEPIMSEPRPQPNGIPAAEFTFTDENSIILQERLKELRDMEVDVPDYKCSADVLNKMEFSPAYFPSSSIFFDYFIE